MNNDRHTHLSKLKSWFYKIKQIFCGSIFKKKNLIEQLRSYKNCNFAESGVLHIIEGALQISDMQARDIMIPRSQMICIAENELPGNFLPGIISTGHSRYPVIGESADEIIGILLAKDLLPLLFQEGIQQSFDLKSILRPAIFVPESKRLTALLHNFRTNKNHMAIVVDEYGGVAGLITIEDILEEIVGEIEDESDAEADGFIKPIAEGTFMVKALMPINEFNEFFHSNLNSDEFDTIGGLIMQQLGRMPKRDECVNIDKFQFKVVSADSRRILLLHASLNKNKE